MLLTLILGLAHPYPVFLDSLTNKPIRIVSLEQPDAFLSEQISSFGKNPFRVVGSDTGEYNTRSQINRDGSFFRIRIGSSGLCRQNREVGKCGDKVDMWEIIKYGSGFSISQSGYCLDANKAGLSLRRCDGTNSLFSFQDAELESCLESVDLDSRPRTEADAVKQLKLRNKLSQLEGRDRQKAGKLRKELGEKNDFRKFVERRLPKLKGKSDMEKVMKGLWDSGWRRPKFSWWRPFPNWKFPFCKKLW